MKTWMTGALLVGFANLAEAKLICHTPGQADRLEVTVTGATARAEALIAGGPVSFNGTYFNKESGFFGSVDQADLVDAEGRPATLEVSKRIPVGRGGRGGFDSCGRAGCFDEPIPAIIKAKLRYLESDLVFSCFETF